MANVLDMQIAEEGPRNAIVKLTGVLDSSDVTEVPAFGLTDFANNDQNLVLTGFRVDGVNYSIQDGINLVLAWNGLPPQQIFPLAGRGKIKNHFGGGWLPDMTVPSYDGSIILTSNGFQDGNVYVFTLEIFMVKLYRR